MGRYYLEIEDYNSALSHFKSATIMNGDAIGAPGEIEFNAGTCCSKLSKQEEAREWFEASAKLGYKSPEAQQPNDRSVF